MKYRIVVDAPIEGLFKALIQPAMEAYENVKKKTPTEEQLQHGLSYQVPVAGSKPVKYATIKILKYEKPHVFSMEYTSSTFHKIDTMWLSSTDTGKVEILTQHMEETIRNGQIICSKGKDDPDTIKSMSLMEIAKYRRLASAVKKGLL